MESRDDVDGTYDGDGADDSRGRPSVDIEVVKDALMDILRGVPAFRAIMATAATTPPPAREPPATETSGSAGAVNAGTPSTPARATGKIKAVTSLVQTHKRKQW